MNLLRPISCLLLALLLGPCAFAADEQEYVVVVHEDCKVENLTPKELRRIFLGKTKNWPDGTAVLLVLNPNDAVHADFSRDLLNKSPRQLSTYWRKSLYSGRSMMPYVAETRDDLLAYLVRYKNAVSYLSKTALSGPLKPVRIGR